MSTWNWKLPGRPRRSRNKWTSNKLTNQKSEALKGLVLFVGRPQSFAVDWNFLPTPWISWNCVFKICAVFVRLFFRPGFLHSAAPTWFLTSLSVCCGGDYGSRWNWRVGMKGDRKMSNLFHKSAPRGDFGLILTWASLLAWSFNHDGRRVFALYEIARASYEACINI